jgi:hypothetical protein
MHGFAYDQDKWLFYAKPAVTFAVFDSRSELVYSIPHIVYTAYTAGFLVDLAGYFADLAGVRLGVGGERVLSKALQSKARQWLCLRPIFLIITTIK